MAMHKIGPWLFVAACPPYAAGHDRLLYTFLRAHTDRPAEVVDLLRGFGHDEISALHDAASCLVDAKGLPLVK